MSPQKQYSKVERGVESAREIESPVKIMDQNFKQEPACESV